MNNSPELTPQLKKADSALKEASDTWNKNEYHSKSPAEKAKALPKLASQFNSRIFNAAYHIRKLSETEWKTTELQARAEIIKRQLEDVRTRMRYFLRQEMTTHTEQSFTDISSGYNAAKEELEKGEPLNYVRLLEDYGNLKLATMLTKRSQTSRLLSWGLSMDTEDTPETVSMINSDTEPLMLSVNIDALARLRRILENNQTTREVILERPVIQELIKVFEEDMKRAG